jgi:hypothetical protein
MVEVLAAIISLLMFPLSLFSFPITVFAALFGGVL